MGCTAGQDNEQEDRVESLYKALGVEISQIRDQNAKIMPQLKFENSYFKDVNADLRKKLDHFQNVTYENQLLKSTVENLEVQLLKSDRAKNTVMAQMEYSNQIIQNITSLILKLKCQHEESLNALKKQVFQLQYSLNQVLYMYF